MARLAGGDVVNIQLAAGFIDDLIFVIGAGPANIPFGAMGELVGLFGFGVVGVEIEGVVFVGGEENFVADHMGSRWARGSSVIFSAACGFQIENVEFARARPPEYRFQVRKSRKRRRVDDRLPIGENRRRRTWASEAAREAAFRRDGVAASPRSKWSAQAAVDDAFAVGGPAVHLIVVAPAFGERAVRGIEGELLRHAPAGGDHVDLLVAVVLAGEGDPFPVGGEFREELEAGMRGEARGGAAGLSRPSRDRRRR